MAIYSVLQTSYLFSPMTGLHKRTTFWSDGSETIDFISLSPPVLIHIVGWEL